MIVKIILLTTKARIFVTHTSKTNKLVKAAGYGLYVRGFESQSSHILSLFPKKMRQKLSKFVSILACASGKCQC